MWMSVIKYSYWGTYERINVPEFEFLDLDFDAYLKGFVLYFFILFHNPCGIGWSHGSCLRVFDMYFKSKLFLGFGPHHFFALVCVVDLLLIVVPIN